MKTMSFVMLASLITYHASSVTGTQTTTLNLHQRDAELADDVTRHQRVVRSKLECASACAENQHYCMTFSACKLGSGSSTLNPCIISTLCASANENAVC